MVGKVRLGAGHQFHWEENFMSGPGSGRDGRGDERVGQEGQAGWEGETRDVGSEQATSNGR